MWSCIKTVTSMLSPIGYIKKNKLYEHTKAQWFISLQCLHVFQSNLSSVCLSSYWLNLKTSKIYRGEHKFTSTGKHWAHFRVGSRFGTDHFCGQQMMLDWFPMGWWSIPDWWIWSPEGLPFFSICIWHVVVVSYKVGQSSNFHFWFLGPL